MSLWTRSSLFVLACAAAACGRAGAATPAPPLACAEGQAWVREKQHDLAEGRLLRALAPVTLDPGACAAEARQLASIALAASVSLGDGAALRRSPWAPLEAQELFAPDGPVVPFRDAAAAAAAYHSAVTAYRAGQWETAGKLGLAVGASAGELAPEGFILAARSAEREGLAARAARMWARAHRAGCGTGSSCAVEPPCEDLFGQTAFLGRFVSWYSASLCFRGSTHGVVVNGTWLVSPSSGKPHEPRALDVREIPSRTLLDRIDVPDFGFVCLSRDGRRRFGVLRDEDGKSFQVGSLGEAWQGRRIAVEGFPAPEKMHVADDGRLIDVGGNYAYDLEHEGSTLLMAGDVQVQLAHMGAGVVFLQFVPEDDVTGRRRYGIARWTIGAATSQVIFESDVLPQELGPPDAKNRFIMALGKGWVWMDGMTGKKLGGFNDASLSLDSFEPLGAAQPGRLVLNSRRGGAEEVWAVEVMTGKKERVAWLWHPPHDDVEETTRVLDELPVGSSTWGEAPGWSVVPSGGWSRYPTVGAAGKPTLAVVVAADRKGAMVVDEAGRFEILGEVSPLFLTSASCRPRTTDTPPPATPTWPLEVCAAAQEHRGLTEAWFRDLRAVAAPPTVPR